MRGCLHESEEEEKQVRNRLPLWSPFDISQDSREVIFPGGIHLPPEGRAEHDWWVPPPPGSSLHACQIVQDAFFEEHGSAKRGSWGEDGVTHLLCSIFCYCVASRRLWMVLWGIFLISSSSLWGWVSSVFQLVPSDINFPSKARFNIAAANTSNSNSVWF